MFCNSIHVIIPTITSIWFAAYQTILFVNYLSNLGSLTGGE